MVWGLNPASYVLIFPKSNRQDMLSQSLQAEGSKFHLPALRLEGSQIPRLEKRPLSIQPIRVDNTGVEESMVCLGYASFHICSAPVWNEL